MLPQGKYNLRWIINHNFDQFHSLVKLPHKLKSTRLEAWVWEWYISNDVLIWFFTLISSDAIISNWYDCSCRSLEQFGAVVMQWWEWWCSDPVWEWCNAFLGMHEMSWLFKTFNKPNPIMSIIDSRGKVGTFCNSVNIEEKSWKVDWDIVVFLGMAVNPKVYSCFGWGQQSDQK